MSSDVAAPDPHFPHLGLAVDDAQFVSRLWQALHAGGHLLALDHVRASVAIVDKSFQPPPPQPVTV